jgi:hypothetical protein
MSKMRLPPNDGPGQVGKVLPFRPVAPVPSAEQVPSADQVISTSEGDHYRAATGPADLPIPTSTTRNHPLLMAGMLNNGQATAMVGAGKLVTTDMAGQATVVGNVELNSRTALRSWSSDTMVVTGDLAISDMPNLQAVELLRFANLVTIHGRLEVEGL